uniref:F-box domain, leucine-rich repeat domain, L domain-like protein n=1 Tax=Tanacetum cinerariifolium TaxID=118510 RepID=A0A699IYL2_TANCI|nr:F-box domain, leucine-rich repeat domain, L domain-like protein [Tanacetum cinerariifolium]
MVLVHVYCMIRVEGFRPRFPTTSTPTALDKRQDYSLQNEVVRQGGIRLERVDTCKEVFIGDAISYNSGKQGHYSKNYSIGKFRDKSYFREKMLLVAKEEQGESLTINENDLFVNTNDEGEQLEANVVFMARLEKVDAFKDEHVGVTEISRDHSHGAFINKSSQVHHELVDHDHSTMLQSYS